MPILIKIKDTNISVAFSTHTLFLTYITTHTSLQTKFSCDTHPDFDSIFSCAQIHMSGVGLFSHTQEVHKMAACHDQHVHSPEHTLLRHQGHPSGKLGAHQGNLFPFQMQW